MTGRQNNPLRQSSNLRRNIAALAARLMAEEGIDDFGFAKRKAARQLGAHDSEALPTNAEVDEALCAYRALYRDEEDDERLAQMRHAAVEAMRLFSPFRPYLTGTVLNGTAGAFSEVELDIYAESAKDVEIFMLNKGMRYEHREPRRGIHDAPEAILVFDWEDVPFKLSIFDHAAERAPRRQTAGGRLVDRAQLEAVVALLEKVHVEPNESDS
ncbi:MAG TPA: hypothetical protein VFW00_07975 [Rhodocyclaceae bacterium]|nr:hypothetical protein [Rhodocyclaceae bacterium]